jgi:hypothetical protein
MVNRVALFFILHSAFCVLHSFANEISVDKRTMQLDDTVTITVTLEDDFAKVDTLRLPLHNLILAGPPSVSSQFEWINGQSSRRKVFRYTARPHSAGEARVGPLTLRGSGGQVETLAPISIQVLPDAAAGSNDPLKILRELMATNRDAIFMVADADKTSVFAGEEIVVTWTLYNATTVQQYAIGDIPKLDDFWTEELDIRGEQPQQVILGGMVVQKLPVRRVALFPLRSGSLTVPAMGVNASIMKRISTGGPFGLFEGMEIDVHRRSAPLTIRARPIPPGPPVAAVGDVALRCGAPVQRNGGPVAVEVALSGRANLRAAIPPSFEKPVEGSVQTIAGRLNVDRRRDDATMLRRWQYLIFPSHSGEMVVPAISATILSTAGVRQQLRCEAATLSVRAASPEPPPPRLASPRHPITVRGLAAWAGATIVICGVIAFAVARAQRGRRIRAEVRCLVRSTAPETRAAVDDYLLSRGMEPASLIREPSDRGDAYRSLRSLLDALERDRVVAGEQEIAARVRDVVTA